MYAYLIRAHHFWIVSFRIERTPLLNGSVPHVQQTPLLNGFVPHFQQTPLLNWFVPHIYFCIDSPHIFNGLPFWTDLSHTFSGHHFWMYVVFHGKYVTSPTSTTLQIGWLIDWFLVLNTTFSNISAISWRL